MLHTSWYFILLDETVSARSKVSMRASIVYRNSVASLFAAFECVFSHHIAQPRCCKKIYEKCNSIVLVAYFFKHSIVFTRQGVARQK